MAGAKILWSAAPVAKSSCPDPRPCRNRSSERPLGRDACVTVISWLNPAGGPADPPDWSGVGLVRRAGVGGIGVGEFGAEQNDLRRVVDPDQQDDNGGGRTVSRLEALRADVPADGELAEIEQNRGGYGSRKHIAPGDVSVGK